jgi:xylitol oxidase
MAAGRTQLTEPLANWAGNVDFGAERFHRPTRVEDLRRLIAGSSQVRALGTGHSFSPVADTTGDLVSLADLPSVIDIDTSRNTVRVGPGVRYGELARYLNDAGYALGNLGSLAHIGVAGACATATHGSGDANGNLATAVSALEMITADGDVVTLTRDGDGEEFRGAVVALGALGVVISLSLDIRPAFTVRQWVYTDLPREQLDEHLATIFASAYSVSLFTTWRSPRIDQVWLKQWVSEPCRGDAAPVWRGARLADGPRHPVPGQPAASCTQQLGVPGPWHERLPHFRLEYTPSSGQELQSEYLLPRARALEALHAIAAARDRVAAVLQVCEIRTVAADDLWLSPSYHRDTTAIHFTWISDLRAVAPVIALVEAALTPFEPRPHWGKIFGLRPEFVRGQYERLPDFQRLLRRYDPAGVFRNQMLNTYIPVA